MDRRPPYVNRLPTMTDIPDDEKNEWGFPLAALWRFFGFVAGAGRFARREVEPTIEEELALDE